jgi:peptidyl-prolyl cis-trans isomerase D
VEYPASSKLKSSIYAVLARFPQFVDKHNFTYFCPPFLNTIIIMSIIQSLRDKAAVLLTGLIALSLIGFLVQDAFIGRSSGAFTGNTTTVGSINGTEIDAQEFNTKVRMFEESNRQQGMQSNEMMTQNIVENVWNTYIQENLIKTEADKLGISFTAKEMGDLLFSENAPQEFKQLFTDQTTGQFNIQAARTWFSNIKKSKKPEEVKMVNEQLIDPLITRQLAEKYSTIISQGSYVPKWMVEKLTSDNSAFASLNYAMVPYGTIADTAVKVSDDEINKYVSNHKDEFKQDKTRSIAYVTFDANPTSVDSAAVFNKLVAVKEELASATDPKSVVARNGSTMPYFDGYVLKSRLAMDAKDSLVAVPVGGVVGPYRDANAYVVAKKVDVRQLPDSVKVRHILIGVVDPRTGQPRRADSAAKKTVDSLFAAIKSGADFRTIAATFSEDEGSKNNGGEYNFSSVDMGNLAKGFSDFAFYKPTGSRDVVKTEFGYHIMEVMSQKNFEESYKIAYVSKPILSSEETDNTASSAATQFAGNSRDLKSFEQNISKNNLSKRMADGIKEIDYSVSGMPSRSFVKWIWENKVGTVSEPFDFKDKYVVAVITGANETGVQSAAAARITVEPIIRNQKKAALIIKKVGNAPTLEAMAAAGGQTGQIDTLRFSDPFIPNIGPEVRVIGAAFNKANQGKVSGFIEGQTGVFAVKTNAIGALPNTSGGDLENQRRAMQAQLKQYSAYGSFEALKKAAKIEDTRRAAGF